ncbi:transient receptor potential cation channel subfamily a member 1-like [Gigaspora margarita]|uniref:Transient receptor potential cation channel subfamily a member 1-like n=1 Tax=Gigaspora margarita TaxID=4874 RepID=A0A8H4EK56_GIGMA|nr:transient receptor potential cation channel subfamily a member 1-like [Gigaspora margarita]
MLCFLIVATIKGLSNNTQNLLLIATIILGFLHLIFEIRQFIYSPLSWITDVWNYFDIGAILFPVLTSIDWLQSSTTPIWAVTISILLLELKFITFFCAIEFGGTHWAMIIGIISEIELFYMLPYQCRKNNWFPEIIFYRFSLDKLYDIISKIKNNNWDDTIEKPFLSNSLLKIVDIDKTEIEEVTQKAADNEKIIQKLEHNEKMIQKLTENENKLIQKLEDNEKIIQELKKFLMKELELREME